MDRSDGRPGGREEGQHDIVALQVAERDRLIQMAGEREIRCLLAAFQFHIGVLLVCYEAKYNANKVRFHRRALTETGFAQSGLQRNGKP